MSERRRLAFVTSYLALSVSLGGSAFSQEVPITRERPKVTASFSYGRDSSEKTINEIVRAMEVRADTERSIDLKTLNQSPVTTMLEVTRFLTSAPYKRANGKPLIDLTF